MPIIVNLVRVIAKLKISLDVLFEKVRLILINLSILKKGKP